MKPPHKQFFLLFFLSTFIANSQTFVYGDFFKLKKDSELNYLGKDSSYLFYLSSKQSKRTYLLLRFDHKTLKLVNQKEIEFDDSQEEIVMSSLEGNRLVIKTKKYHRRMEPVVNSYFINCYSLEILKATDSLKLPKSHSSIQVPGRNPDNPVTYNFVSGVYQHGLSDYKMIIEQGTEKLILNHDYQIKNEVEPDTSVFYYNKYYKSVSIYYPKDNVDAVKMKEINLGNERKIIEYESQLMKNGNIRILGKYYSKINAIVAYGLFQVILDKKLNEIKKPGFLSLIEGENLGPDLKSHPNSGFLFNGKNVNCMVKTNSGSLVYVYNKIILTNEMVTSSSYDGKQFHTRTNWVQFMNVSEINMINFHPSGMIFKNTIPLKQKTSEHEVSVSFICKVIDNQLCFLFFDHKGNLKKGKDDEDGKTCYFEKSTVFVKCFYNMNDNKIGNKEVFLTQDEFLQFFNMNSYRLYLTDDFSIQIARDGANGIRLQKIQM